MALDLDIDDAEALQRMLCTAKSAAVDPKLISRAEERLNELLQQLQVEQSRREAEAALLRAMDEQAIASLEEAIAHAEELKVDVEVLAKAMAALQDLQGQAEAARAAQEATTRLRLLLQDENLHDPEPLRGALAAVAGPAELLRQGEARLQELLAHQEALRRQQAARQRLVRQLDAVVQPELGELQLALAEAEQAEVEQELVAKGKRRWEELSNEEERARRSLLGLNELLAAMKQEDLKILMPALAAAKAAQINPDILLQAERLVEELRRRSEAEAALTTALELLELADSPKRTQSLQGLADALASAEAARVASELCSSARVRLLMGREVETRRATEDLVAAMAGEQVEPLRVALEKAHAADVSRALLEDGRTKLKELTGPAGLPGPAQHAAQALRRALELGDLRDLEEAMEQARRAGVTRQLLDEGEQRLRQLLAQLEEEGRRSQRQAQQALLDAMARRDLGSLRAALANPMKVEPGLLMQARAFLAAGEAQEALWPAMEGSDPQVLEVAIAAAEHAGVDADVLRMAGERLNSLRMPSARQPEAAQRARSRDLPFEREWSLPHEKGTSSGGAGAGLPNKKKSTPIRPSLMGQTLVDGGTLMLWKSGDAPPTAPRTASRPPAPALPGGGAPGRPTSARPERPTSAAARPLSAKPRGA